MGRAKWSHFSKDRIAEYYGKFHLITTHGAYFIFTTIVSVWRNMHCEKSITGARSFSPPILPLNILKLGTFVPIIFHYLSVNAAVGLYESMGPKHVNSGS
jgi:hypothetical protein